MKWFIIKGTDIEITVRHRGEHHKETISLWRILADLAETNAEVYDFVMNKLR